MKTAAERMREYRTRIKQNPDVYKTYLQRDKDRKRAIKETMSPDDLKELANSSVVSTQKWRKKKREAQKLNALEGPSRPSRSAFKSKQSLGKAKRKALGSLPKSPRKKMVIVRELVKDVLNINVQGEPKEKSGNPGLAGDKVNLIQEYYREQARMMPGKSDTISVKTATGKETKQKSTMVMTIAECFESFKLQNPEVQVSFSKFAELRPKEVLLCSQTPRNVCGCKYHNNIILILEALHGKTTVPLYSRNGFLPLCVCNTTSEDCMRNDCDECQDGAKLKQYLTATITDEQQDMVINWSQWQEEDGFLIRKPNSNPVRVVLQELLKQIPKFLWHAFLKEKQEKAYEEEKKLAQNADSSKAVVQMDFAENYTIQFQDEIQSAHWRQRQVSIFTVMIYFRNEVKSWVILSDFLQHEKTSVSAYIYKILLYFSTLDGLTEISFWTDGPASQFKNKFMFSTLLFLQTCFQNQHLSWNFFATAHGKGPNDALGGRCKRIVHRLALTRQWTILDAKSFCSALLSANGNIMVTTLSEQEIRQVCVELRLPELWNDAPTMPGISNMHHITTQLEESKVAAKYYGSSNDVIRQYAIPRVTNGNDDMVDAVMATEDTDTGDTGNEPAGPIVEVDHLQNAGVVIDPTTSASEAAASNPVESDLNLDVTSNPTAGTSALESNDAETNDALTPSTENGMAVELLELVGLKRKKKGQKKGKKEVWCCHACRYKYGQKNDPRYKEDWFECETCKKRYHASCAEANGILEDEDGFTCKDCIV